MEKVTVTCDRCQKEVEGLELAGSEATGQPGGTSGFYRVGERYGDWSHFANGCEQIICDTCMLKDARYRRLYPQPGQLTVTFQELEQIFRFAEHETAEHFDGRTCTLFNKHGRKECPICFFSIEVHKALAAMDPSLPPPRE